MTNKEIDLLIAKFMGISYDDYPFIFCGRSFYSFTPSADMNDAMEVIQKLQGQGKGLNISSTFTDYNESEGEYHVSDANYEGGLIEGWTFNKDPDINEYGNDLPRLICLVTLKVLRCIK